MIILVIKIQKKKKITEKIINIYHEFQKEFDLDTEFIKNSSEKIKNQYRTTEYLSLSNFFTKKGNISDNDIAYALFYLIWFTLDHYTELDKKDDTINKIFSKTSRYLELFTKYYEKEIIPTQLIFFYQISAMNYDLSDNIANTIFLSKKINKFIDEDVPIEFFDRIAYLNKRNLYYFLSRDYDKNIQLCNEIQTYKKDFESLISNNGNETLNLQEVYNFTAIQFQTKAIYDTIKIIRKLITPNFKEILETQNKSRTYFLKANNETDFIISDLLYHIFEKIEKRAISNYLNKEKEIWNKYFKILNDNRIYEFWPPQIKALEELLIKKTNNFIITAPTSSGKTMIGELAIVQNFDVFPNSKCFYIVPSRALANQKTKELRKKFSGLNLKVIKFIGGANHEIDNIILNSADIGVFTPEKYYQIRRNREDIFNKAKLIIFDEAHLIGEGIRGINLEFEISSILSKYPTKRIILISAVVKNHNDLNKWIRQSHIVSEEWKPTKTIKAILTSEGYLKFYGELNGIEIPVINLKRKNLMQKAVELAKVYYKNLGQTMIFSNTRNNAEKMAELLYKDKILIKTNDPIKYNSQINDLKQKINRELGSSHPLINYIEHGIVYHHGSLPNVVKETIEELIDKNYFKIIVATTTLAEGINTPVSCLIIPYTTLYENNYQIPMKKSLFNNLVGRVGRAIKNSEGYVFLIQPPTKSIEEMEEYIEIKKEKIENLQSHLVELIKGNVNKQMFNNLDEKSTQKILLFQTNLIVALANRVFDGASIDKMLAKTFFGVNLKKEDKIFKKAAILIKNCLDYMENLKKPVLVRRSPYKITNFGYICYNSNLSPLTLNRFYEGIVKYIKDDRNFLKSLNKVPTKLTKPLINLFSLFKEGIEIMEYSSMFDYFSPERFSEIIFSWLIGKNYNEIFSNFFKDFDQNPQRKCVDFIQILILNYFPWFSFGILNIIKYLNQDSVEPYFLRNLSNFLLTGTMNWNEMMIILLDITDRNDYSKEISELFPDIDYNLQDKDLIKNFIATIKELTLEQAREKINNDYDLNRIWKKIDYYKKFFEENEENLINEK